VFCGVALAGEETEQFADGGMPTGWLGRREMGLDLVAVAAAVLMLGHVAGAGQVGDDGVGAALGDTQRGSDVAQPDAGVAGDGQQDPGVVGQRYPVPLER
jgi:hypothetical protein